MGRAMVTAANDGRPGFGVLDRSTAPSASLVTSSPRASIMTISHWVPEASRIASGRFVGACAAAGIGAAVVASGSALGLVETVRISPVNIERLPAQFHRPAIGEQLAAMRQDPETAEVDGCSRIGCETHELIVNPISEDFKVFNEQCQAATYSTPGIEGRRPRQNRVRREDQGRPRPMLLLDWLSRARLFQRGRPTAVVDARGKVRRIETAVRRRSVDHPRHSTGPEERDDE